MAWYSKGCGANTGVKTSGETKHKKYPYVIHVYLNENMFNRMKDICKRCGYKHVGEFIYKSAIDKLKELEDKEFGKKFLRINYDDCVEFLLRNRVLYYIMCELDEGEYTLVYKGKRIGVVRVSKIQEVKSFNDLKPYVVYTPYKDEVEWFKEAWKHRKKFDGGSYIYEIRLIRGGGDYAK